MEGVLMMQPPHYTGFANDAGPGDWSFLGDGACAWFNAPSLAGSALLAGRIAEVFQGGTLPDIDLRSSGLRIHFDPGAPGRFSDEEAARARAISTAARELGMASDPDTVQVMQLAIDASDSSSQGTFWQTVLGYEHDGAARLEDPTGRDPAISWASPSAHNDLRGRIHVDVVRPPGQVEAVRSTLGQEPFGANGLTLADIDGNEVDLVPGGVLSPEPDTSDWSVAFGATASYPAASGTVAVSLATAVAELADEAKIPLLVDLRPGPVTIDSGKDQWDDAERSDGSSFVALAGRIQAAARGLGLTAERGRTRFVQFGVDAIDVDAVRGFWASVLGYAQDPRPSVTDIVDPRRLNPVLFFQQMDPVDEDRRRARNRLHIELQVSTETARLKTEAVLEAGGRALTGQNGLRRTFADPEGNELTLLTPPQGE